MSTAMPRIAAALTKSHTESLGMSTSTSLSMRLCLSLSVQFLSWGCRRMSDEIRKLKAHGDPRWRLLLVESFEASLQDPTVSSNVEHCTIPPNDPCVALRGQLGLKAVNDSDIFVIGIYRCRTMSDVPTFQEQERWVLHDPLSNTTSNSIGMRTEPHAPSLLLLLCYNQLLSCQPLEHLQHHRDHQNHELIPRLLVFPPC